MKNPFLPYNTKHMSTFKLWMIAYGRCQFGRMDGPHHTPVYTRENRSHSIPYIKKYRNRKKDSEE